MKNNHMRRQIRTAIASLRAFQQGLRTAATMDDGVIDAEEKAEIEIINRLTDKYIENIKAVADGNPFEEEKKKGFFKKKK